MYPYAKTKQISYNTTQDELEAIEQEPVISPEEAEWSRRQRIIETSRSCQQVCQIQLTNEPQHEGTCSIKDVGVDTIHMLTKSLEEASKTLSNDSDDSPIQDNIYSASKSESSDVNNENLSIDLITVKP